jgi:uncharacterized protein YyaL (SSP411 family)
LAKLTGDEKYERFAVTILRLVAAQIKRYPQAFGRLLSATRILFESDKGNRCFGRKGNELEREIWREFLPNKIVVLSAKANENDELIPLLRGRKLIDGKPTFTFARISCVKSRSLMSKGCENKLIENVKAVNRIKNSVWFL